ncbi:MAG TPA: hypothetical protein VK618_06470 [Flavitalea sp.]|nr:hypothetical protein [Flavitalea sp.]
MNLNAGMFKFNLKLKIGLAQGPGLYLSPDVVFLYFLLIAFALDTTSSSMDDQKDFGQI